MVYFVWCLSMLRYRSKLMKMISTKVIEGYILTKMIKGYILTTTSLTVQAVHFRSIKFFFIWNKFFKKMENPVRRHLWKPPTLSDLTWIGLRTIGRRWLPISRVPCNLATSWTKTKQSHKTKKSNMFSQIGKTSHKGVHIVHNHTSYIN